MHNFEEVLVAGRTNNFDPGHTKNPGIPSPRFAVMLALLLASFPLQAQKASEDPQAHIPSPEKLAAILKQPCAAENASLYRALHLGCRPYAEVAFARTQLEHGSDNAVITVHDDDSASIVVLELKHGEWSHVDTRLLVSKYDEPKFSFLSLVEPDVREIAVSQETLIRGTDVLENHQVIYKLLNSKLRLVFDERAKALLKGWGTETDWEEQSDFRYEAAKKGEVGTIYQRIIRRDHSKRTTMFRCYAWDKETERFRQMPTRDYDDVEWSRFPRFYSRATKIIGKQR